LTMDQDSSWVNCHEYVSWVKENHRDTVAIYAPDVNGQSKEWTTGTEEQNFNSVITSGSLCNVAIADRLGGFREDYQIYWIDEEYCQWARKNGYEIIVLPKYTIQQCFGNSSKTKWGFYTLNYSPKVYYFLVRNSIWLKRNHFGSPSLCFVCCKVFTYLRGILLSESQKNNKLKMVFRGVWDGVFCKLGNRQMAEKVDER